MGNFGPAQLAKLVGARDAADVAFACSGTHALNATISGMLRPGDAVLATAIEHNSVLRHSNTGEKRKASRSK